MNSRIILLTLTFLAAAIASTRARSSGGKRTPVNGSRPLPLPFGRPGFLFSMVYTEIVLG